MTAKNDESLEVIFLGSVIKYTMLFNEIKRSSCVKGSDSFDDILKNRAELCYLPTCNACFRKCLKFIYETDFSNEYKENIIDSDRCQNSMNFAKIQPFCDRCGLDISLYNLKKKLGYSSRQ